MGDGSTVVGTQLGDSGSILSFVFRHGKTWVDAVIQHPRVLGMEAKLVFFRIERDRVGEGSTVVGTQLRPSGLFLSFAFQHDKTWVDAVLQHPRVLGIEAKLVFFRTERDRVADGSTAMGTQLRPSGLFRSFAFQHDKTWVDGPTNLVVQHPGVDYAIAADRFAIPIHMDCCGTPYFNVFDRGRKFRGVMSMRAHIRSQSSVRVGWLAVSTGLTQETSVSTIALLLYSSNKHHCSAFCTGDREDVAAGILGRSPYSKSLATRYECLIHTITHLSLFRSSWQAVDCWIRPRYVVSLHSLSQTIFFSLFSVVRIKRRQGLQVLGQFRLMGV